MPLSRAKKQGRAGGLQPATLARSAQSRRRPGAGVMNTKHARVEEDVPGREHAKTQQHYDHVGKQVEREVAIVGLGLHLIF